MTNKKDLTNFYKESKSYPEKIQKEKNKLKEGRIKYLLKKIKDGDSFLDVGCGPGLLVSEVAKNKSVKVFGVDISPHAISFAKKNSPKSSLTIGDVERLDFKDEQFNVISSFEVLEHLENPEKCLSEMLRCCKKGGHVVISVPAWFIGVGKRDLWVLNVVILPFILLHLYLRSFMSKGLSIKKLVPHLDLKDWEKKPLSKMADLDACSWISPRSLESFFKEKNFSMELFNSYQFLEDMIYLKRGFSFKDVFMLTLMKILKKMPFLKYFGSGVFIVARKK